MIFSCFLDHHQWLEVNCTIGQEVIEMAESAGLTSHSGLVTVVTIDTTATTVAAGRLLPFEYLGCLDHINKNLVWWSWH